MSLNYNDSSSVYEEIKHLSNRTFALIELVELAGISDHSFMLIRKKILNLGNDILRLEEKIGNKDGDADV